MIVVVQDRLAQSKGTLIFFFFCSHAHSISYPAECINCTQIPTCTQPFAQSLIFDRNLQTPFGMGDTLVVCYSCGYIFGLE